MGTGFTQGPPLEYSDEETVASQFLGFFKNFLATFALHDKNIFITGESYAGKYIPYLADAMLRRNDTSYFGVKGIQIIDPRWEPIENLRYTRIDPCLIVRLTPSSFKTCLPILMS